MTITTGIAATVWKGTKEMVLNVIEFRLTTIVKLNPITARKKLPVNQSQKSNGPGTVQITIVCVRMATKVTDFHAKKSTIIRVQMDFTNAHETRFAIMMAIALRMTE